MAEILPIKKPTCNTRTSRNHRARSIKLVNFETGESVSILPGLGATVRELILRCEGKPYSLLEYPESYEELVENKHFAGVKLIPFPGRVSKSTFQFGRKTYKLKPRSNKDVAIHGFFCDKPYQLSKTNVGENAASVVLTSTHNGKTKGYPFRFEVRLTYRLEGGSFSCRTEILNTDTRSIPIGDGWHPYFKTTGRVKRLSLSMPAHSVVEVTAAKFPTGEMRKAVRKRSIIPLSNKTLDSVFDFGEKRQIVTTSLIDRKNGLGVKLWQESGAGRYRYLVLYRPVSGNSIAIEPWTCAPDALNNDMGLIILKPGGKFKASYGVKLERLRR